MKLNYCTEYKVQYSNTGFPNYLQEQINDVLGALVENQQDEIVFYTDALCYADTLEIAKDTIRKIIPILERGGDEWGDVTAEVKELDKPYLQIDCSDLGQAGITPIVFAKNLQDALDNAEPSLDCIKFEWMWEFD